MLMIILKPVSWILLLVLLLIETPIPLITSNNKHGNDTDKTERLYPWMQQQTLNSAEVSVYHGRHNDWPAVIAKLLVSLCSSVLAAFVMPGCITAGAMMPNTLLLLSWYDRTGPDDDIQSNGTLFVLATRTVMLATRLMINPKRSLNPKPRNPKPLNPKLLNPIPLTPKPLNHLNR